MKTYSQILKDPRWQKKRLEIMERSDFHCEDCGDSKSTLNVHHIYYDKKLQPWEYESKYLKCFCESCHDRWHEDRKEFLKNVADIESFDSGPIQILYWLAIYSAKGEKTGLHESLLSLSWGLLNEESKNENFIERLIEHLKCIKKLQEEDLQEVSK